MIIYLGFVPAAILQSQGHVLDHAPPLDALERDQGRYRGVNDLRTLRHIEKAETCGIRFSFRPNLDMVGSAIAKVTRLGWHIAIRYDKCPKVLLTAVIACVSPSP